jgi:hypothetical protein
VVDDPLLRMPGTQQDEGITFDTASNCTGCHDNYDPNVDIVHLWGGSMMAQATRDPLFWAAVTVAAQDSIWVLGRPNATDLCLRCHTPAGWMGGRSDPTNGSDLGGADFDGITCEACHKMYDPHFEDTFAGLRESSDWTGYWDEATSLSATEAQTTYGQDLLDAATAALFNGNAFYDTSNLPPVGYAEASAGQMFMSDANERRGSFADANANHSTFYSRFHKSRYFCATCHDVSNSVLANLAYDGTTPGDGTTVLPTETQPGHAYGHIERTFSEFMLSDFGLPGGAAGSGDYDPSVFDTSTRASSTPPTPATPSPPARTATWPTPSAKAAPRRKGCFGRARAPSTPTAVSRCTT